MNRYVLMLHGDLIVFLMVAGFTEDNEGNEEKKILYILHVLHGKRFLIDMPGEKDA